MNYFRISKLNILIIVVALILSDIKANVDWQKVEESAQNCVIQIFSQLAKFNWAEPYKSPEHMQVKGSGFFINSDGYILTNFHVVSEATSMFCNIPALGKKRLDLEVVGVCPDLDAALLKLKPESLALLVSKIGQIKYLELGDSDILFRTEPVLALGYPLGERYLKATVGVIAGREYIGGKSFMHMTAAINPGNSGGPLLNLSGKVVGINSAGIPGAQNIGYIVPINDIKIMLEDLYRMPLCRRPELGILCNHSTDEHVVSLKNPVPGGYFINYVLENSIAAKSGLLKGDMLYSIIYNGQEYPVDEYGDVTVNWRSSDKVSIGELLMRFEIGSDLGLLVYRNGQEVFIKTKFENSFLYPIREIYPEFEKDQIDYEVFGGLVVMQLRENHFKLLQSSAYQLRDYYAFESQIKKALIITKILPGSILHKVECFQPGSVLDSVNGQKVQNLDDLRKALEISIETGDISITTKDHFSTVVSLEKLLKDEPRLAYSFMFPISPTLKKIFSLVTIDQDNL